MGLGDSLGPGTTDRSLRRSFPPTLSIQYVKEQARVPYTSVSHACVTPNVFGAGGHVGPPGEDFNIRAQR
jgi:hypothetical protein